MSDAVTFENAWLVFAMTVVLVFTVIELFAMYRRRRTLSQCVWSLDDTYWWYRWVMLFFFVFLWCHFFIPACGPRW